MSDLLNILKRRKDTVKGAHLMQGIGNIAIAYLFAVANHIVLLHGNQKYLFKRPSKPRPWRASSRAIS